MNSSVFGKAEKHKISKAVIFLVLVSVMKNETLRHFLSCVPPVNVVVLSNSVSS